MLEFMVDIGVDDGDGYGVGDERLVLVLRALLLFTFVSPPQPTSPAAETAVKKAENASLLILVSSI